MYQKTTLLILFILIQSTVFSQSKLFRQSHNDFAEFGFSEEELDVHKKEGDLSVFNEAKHKTRLALTLFDKGVGKKHKEKIRTGTRTYEVIAEREVMHYRINYIFLDANRKKPEAVARLRTKIQELLSSGIQFESLARQYSMDRNSYSGGDSGWFKEERTVPEFFKEINNSQLLANQVYEIDLAEANWYYLVKKAFTPVKIREILVKISE